MEFFMAFILVWTFANANNQDDLNRDGIWVNYNPRNESLPENFVIGGHVGDTIYIIIRADHYDEDGSYCGKIVGKYGINMDYATIPYNKKEHHKYQFEILTHTNYIWQNKVGQPNYLIPGGIDSFGNTIYICRITTWFFHDQIPGKLHNGSCWVSGNGKEHEHSDWATLKRNYNNL